MVTCRTDRKSMLLAPTMVDLVASLYYHPSQPSENTLVLLFGVD